MPQQTLHLHNQQESDSCDLEEILLGLNLRLSLGISQAIRRFEATSTIPRNHASFWKEIFKRIDERDVVEFLNNLVIAESADMYDIKNAFSSMPQEWRGKASVKRNWSNILEAVARRFATHLTDQSTLEYFMKDIGVEDGERLFITKGILEGLSSNCDLVNASTLFGFPEIASVFISPQQATDLLDFALARFELHMPEDYADGCWSSWLIPPDDISMAFAGFVWSALGSPRSMTRWKAAHCVRRLAETNSTLEINALLKWMEQDKVGAFGSRKFPFYNLHARLYLLIALARVSNNYPQILLCHHETFSQDALGAIKHILIQKFSAEIALNIEKAFPNTYPRDVIEHLHCVGVSELPSKKMKSNSKKIVSYWHKLREVDTSLKFYHGYDFDRYWFEPLGKVFGISGKQIEELATEVVLNDWQVITDGSYKKDPRARFWRSSGNGQETYHSHGSYPQTDDYCFYLSYHSMLVVAAKLLKKMPVMHRRDGCKDEWGEWLSRHLLTREDGGWLADRRDPPPLERRKWIDGRETKDQWLNGKTSDDALDGVLLKSNGDTWLNVFGSWEDGDSERTETLYISSAFVSPEASQSLLNALCSCSDPRDFKVPDYEEENMEFELGPFVLKGWIWRNHTSNRLDEFDPFAGEIYYPPYQIGKSIAEQLGLSADTEQREWHVDGEDKPSLFCAIWSSNKSEYDKDRWRQGMKLSASLQFLRKLCLKTKREPIIEVQINRRFKNKYGRSEDEKEYQGPYSKIYLLSQDGELRDESTNYKLR